MTAKTSYTIPEVAKILFVPESYIVAWADQNKLKISGDCIQRENLILFMKRMGFSTEVLEPSPTKEEEALKDWMFKNKDKLYRALEQHYYDGADCSAEYNEMSVLMGRHLEGK